MKYLDGSDAMNRSDYLEKIPEIGSNFNRLCEAAYAHSRRVESKEGEYARAPIDGQKLAEATAKDVVEGIKNMRRVTPEFQNAVNGAIPEITQRVIDIVAERVEDGRFYGNGHHVRQYIGMNVEDVVGKKLGL